MLLIHLKIVPETVIQIQDTNKQRGDKQCLQEVDKELGQTLFVAESNIKTNVPTSHFDDRRRTCFN